MGRSAIYKSDIRGDELKRKGDKIQASMDMVTMFHELGVDTGINQKMLIDLGKAFRTDVVDMFEAKQKKFDRPFMPCRSFMLTTGKLPKSVTQLYR